MIKTDFPGLIGDWMFASVCEQTSADRIWPVSIRCPNFPDRSVRYLDSVRILCPVSACPDSVCLDSVRCPDSVRNFVKNHVRCLSVRILSVSILSGVRILSGFSKKLCPLSVCPAGQGRDRAVRTFAVLVRRRLAMNMISNIDA